MAAHATPTRQEHERTTVLDRVLVGIDRTEASIEAARQAAVLTEHFGSLSLLGVYPPPRRMGLDEDEEFDVEDGRGQTEAAVAAATAAIASLTAPRATVTPGYAWRELLDAVEREESTLVVLGSHGQRRLEGILAGSTATELLHKAPCSVLVARPADDRFPRRVVVGVDGSAESAQAFAVAHRIAARFGSTLRPVVALGGGRVELDAVARLADGRCEELAGAPVAALVTASADADLLVVGSRGLHGIRALGSVSERVAHSAHCSTLVVRRADPPPRASTA